MRKGATLVCITICTYKTNKLFINMFITIPKQDNNGQGFIIPKQDNNGQGFIIPKQGNNGQGCIAETEKGQNELTLNNPKSINQDSFSFNNIHSLKFLLQAFFSTLVLIFCLSQLYISKGEGRNDALYWGGVTGMLALWMPSPSTSGTPPTTNQPNFETAKSGK